MLSGTIGFEMKIWLHWQQLCSWR